VNANEYDAWVRSQRKARAAPDPVRSPILPGMKGQPRPEKDRFEGFRPPAEPRIEPEYV